MPGSRWVQYARPAARETPRPAAPARKQPRVTVARFLLDGPALPLAVDTVAVAEAFRRAAMSRFQAWCRQNPDQAARFARGADEDGRPRFASPVLAGKDADGLMHKSHGHAHYLPTAETDRRRLTNVTVFAPGGFGPEEVAGLTGVRRVKVKVGPEALVAQAQLVGLGTTDNLRDVDLFKPSAVWESATPFVAYRHLKRRGTKKDTPHLDAAADPREGFVELAAAEAVRLHGLPAAQARVVQPGPVQPPAAAFRRTRERDRGRGYSRACGLVRLTFAEPVPGPICLGYGSHSGLGLFVPQGSRNERSERQSSATNSRTPTPAELE